jgi:hypothetical protein
MGPFMFVDPVPRNDAPSVMLQARLRHTSSRRQHVASADRRATEASWTEHFANALGQPLKCSFADDLNPAGLVPTIRV